MPLCYNADLLNLPPNKINLLIFTYLQWSNGMGSLNPRWGLANSEKADQIKDAHSGSHGNWHEASEGLKSRRYKARSVSRACFLHRLSSVRLVNVFFFAFYSYNICFQDSAPFDTIVVIKSTWCRFIKQIKNLSQFNLWTRYINIEYHSLWDLSVQMNWFAVR